MTRAGNFEIHVFFLYKVIACMLAEGELMHDDGLDKLNK